MKKLFIYMLAIASAAGFTACDDDFVQPPLEEYIPHSSIQPNTTIRELKEAFYQNSAAYSVQIGTKANGDHYIVKGRLVTDDANANLYKKLSIMDETGALIFSINGNGLSETYKFGQEVVVDLTGLYYGNYSGNCLVGGYAAATEGPSRMLKSLWENAAHLDGMPDVAAVDTITYTLDELAALRNNPVDVDLVQGQLVRINGLHFRNPGSPLGDSNFMNNSTTMLNGQNQQLTLNTCGYGTLWSIEAPAGEGDIVGILSNYGNSGYTPSWQVNLLNEYSLIGFEGYDPDAPVKPVMPVIYEESFANGMGAYTIENVVMNAAMSYVWSHDASYSCVKASAYLNGDSYESDSYLISPMLDCTGASDMVLNFEHAANKWSYSSNWPSGMAQDLDYEKYMTLCVRTEGGAWEEVTIPDYPNNTSWSFIKSGEIDLSAYDGKKIQLGLRYQSATGFSGTWEVKNIAISGNGSITVK